LLGLLKFSIEGSGGRSGAGATFGGDGYYFLAESEECPCTMKALESDFFKVGMFLPLLVALLVAYSYILMDFV
jgi:hypothetical protein